MRLTLTFSAVMLACGLQTQVFAQTVLPCTDTGAGYLYCMPPIGSNSGESAATRMNRQTVEQGVNTLTRRPSSEELADAAQGRAIAANPQQSGEDFTDYSIRITKVARDWMAGQNPYVATILTTRLLQYENLKARMQLAKDEQERQAARARDEGAARASRADTAREHSHTDAEIAEARKTAFGGCIASGRDLAICEENADQVVRLMRDGVL